MGVAGKRLKDVGMLEHERKQSTLPIPARHRVGQQQVAERRAFEQERAQSDGAPDVGRDDARGVKAPMLEQSGEAAALRGNAEVLTLTLLRLTVTELIEKEDPAVSRERRNDRTPDQR